MRLGSFLSYTYIRIHAMCVSVLLGDLQIEGICLRVQYACRGGERRLGWGGKILNARFFVKSARLLKRIKVAPRIAVFCSFCFLCCFVPMRAWD